MRSYRSIFALFGLLVAAADFESAAAAELFSGQAVVDPAAEVAAQPAAPTKPAEQSPFPLVLRIDKTALTRYSDSDIDRTGKVEKTVLGTRCVGGSSGSRSASSAPTSAGGPRLFR